MEALKESIITHRTQLKSQISMINLVKLDPTGAINSLYLELLKSFAEVEQNVQDLQRHSMLNTFRTSTPINFDTSSISNYGSTRVLSTPSPSLNMSYTFEIPHNPTTTTTTSSISNATFPEPSLKRKNAVPVDDPKKQKVLPTATVTSETTKDGNDDTDFSIFLNDSIVDSNYTENISSVNHDEEGDSFLNSESQTENEGEDDFTITIPAGTPSLENEVWSGGIYLLENVMTDVISKAISSNKTQLNNYDADNGNPKITKLDPEDPETKRKLLTYDRVGFGCKCIEGIIRGSLHASAAFNSFDNTLRAHNSNCPSAHYARQTSGPGAASNDFNFLGKVVFLVHPELGDIKARNWIRRILCLQYPLYFHGSRIKNYKNPEQKKKFEEITQVVIKEFTYWRGFVSRNSKLQEEQQSQLLAKASKVPIYLEECLKNNQDPDPIQLAALSADAPTYGGNVRKSSKSSKYQTVLIEGVTFYKCPDANCDQKSNRYNSICSHFFNKHKEHHNSKYQTVIIDGVKFYTCPVANCDVKMKTYDSIRTHFSTIHNSKSKTTDNDSL